MVRLKHKKRRAIKTDSEISKIKRAIQNTEKAIKYALSIFKPGMTEKELANKIRKWCKQNKFKLSFLIVQGDKNSASIHSKPSNQKIKRVLLIDIGTIYKGYHSDITRTYLFNPTNEMKKTYRVVKRVQEISIAAIKIGKSCKEIDDIARNLIKISGKRFKHSLGHGVGKQIHEYPKIGPTSNHIFQKNMVFTIEPGIYIKNRFGIRIEDTLVMKNKPIRLSKIKIPEY